MSTNTWATWKTTKTKEDAKLTDKSSESTKMWKIKPWLLCNPECPTCRKVLNLWTLCGQQTRKNVTAARAIWAFLTSGSSKSYTKPPQPSQYNTTYHIHTCWLITKGEEFAEADFSSKDRPFRSGVWVGVGVPMIKTIAYEEWMTIKLFFKVKSFVVPYRSLTDPPEQASEEEWPNTAPSQCTFLEKKDTKTL